MGGECGTYVGEQNGTTRGFDGETGGEEPDYRI